MLRLDVLERQLVDGGDFARDSVVAEAIGTVRTDFRVDDRAVRAVFETSDIRSGKREPRGEFLRRRGGVDKVLQPVVDATAPPEELASRSEEHTSELQSHSDLVCR